MSGLPVAVDLSVKPVITPFFDAATNTVSYVVQDPRSKACAIIDSVMDIDYAAGRISYHSADAIVDFVWRNGLTLAWLIETHVHADHLSAAPYIQGKLGGKIVASETFRPFEVYVVLLVGYAMLTYVVSIAIGALHRRLNRDLVEQVS